MDARHYIIRQQLSALMERAGTTAVLRQYVSASANLQEFGLGTANRYVQRTITGIFTPIPLREINAGGGQYQFGDTQVVTYHPLAKQDELQWQGARWRVTTDAMQYALWGTAVFSTVITRA